MEEYKHIVSDKYVGKDRILDYLVGIFMLLPTKSSVKKAIKRGEIFLNGERASSGDYITPNAVIVYRSNQVIPEPIALDLKVMYDDDYLLVISKPPGIVSSGNYKVTIEKALMIYGKQSTAMDALPYPKIIHRLDRDTCGLIIAAKTVDVKSKLDAALRDKEIEKDYICLVQGMLNDQDRYIDTSINDKDSLTKIIKSYPLNLSDEVSLVRLSPISGRTHQLRIHMSSIGHPIIGDPIYNREGLSFKKGLMLQAIQVKLIHPVTKDTIVVKDDFHKKIKKYIPESF